MKKKTFLSLFLLGILCAALTSCAHTGKQSEPTDSTTASTTANTEGEDTMMTENTEQEAVIPEKNLTITVFWPPNPNKTELSTQFKLMHEFGINEVFGAGNDCDNPEIQKRLLTLCQKYGMTMVVSDGSFGDAVLKKTPEEIQANAAKYADNPTVTGFYLRDEPANPNIYLDAYKAIRKAGVHLDGHINFIHLTAVGNPIDYIRKIGDWASLTNAVCENSTYLMYDYYPFLYDERPFNYAMYLKQLEIVRQLGLKNGNPTGYYVQSAYKADYPFNPANLRMPTAVENRYQIYSALAYGFKKLSYFTWYTGIISLQGVVSHGYSYMSEVNHEALALGPTLVNCDAVDVYMTKVRHDPQFTKLLPDDYCITLADDRNADMIFTRFVHRETGRNYFMFVNNDMTAERSLTFTADEEITGLEVVSRTDGTLSAYPGENGTYTITLAAGDGILLALPADYTCPVDVNKASASISGVNLALEAKVMATSSTGTFQWGEKNWFVHNLTDGLYQPDQMNANTAPGWQSEQDPCPVLTFDLKKTVVLERLVLYPSSERHGEDKRYGTYMPIDSIISASEDGKTWTEIAAIQDYRHDGDKNSEPLQVNLDGAVGRYLRIEVKKAVPDENGTPLTQIGEIQIYGSAAEG